MGYFLRKIIRVPIKGLPAGIRAWTEKEVLEPFKIPTPAEWEAAHGRDNCKGVSGNNGGAEDTKKTKPAGDT